jgi:translocation and assembly module TamB
MKTKMTRLQKAGIAFATTFILLLSLMFSAVGNKLLVWSANRLVTGLDLSLSQGKMLSSGRLDVKYQTQQLSIDGRDLRIELDWFDCATACFSISGHSLDIKVFTPKTVKEPKPAELPEAEDEEDSSLSPPLHVAIKTLDFAKITLSTTDFSAAVNNLHLQADWQQDLLSIAQLQIDAVVIDQNEKPQSSLLEDIAIKVQITPTQIASTTVITKDDQKLTLQTAGPLSEFKVIIDVQGRLAGHVEATVNLTQDNYPFSLQANMPSQSLTGLLTAPLQDLLLHQVSLTASGDANNYRFTLNSKAHAEQVGTVDAKFEVSGDLKQAKIELAEVSIDEATSQFSGAIDWQQGIQATANGNLHQLPLHFLLPDESSQLSGHFNVAFTALTEQWQLKVPSLVLKGQVQGKPIEANIRLALDEQLWGQIEQLDLAYGDSNIQLSGSLAEQLTLDGNVTFDHIADALLPLNLNMQGNLSLSGKRETPTIKLITKLKALDYNQVSLRDGQLNLLIDAGNNFITDVKLSAEQLSVNELSLSNISLDAYGDANNHQLNMTSKGALDSDIKLTGSWQNDQWKGLLQQIELNYKTTQQTLPLKAKLMAPVEVVASTNLISLSNHCWQIEHNELCLQAKHQIQKDHSFGESLVTIKHLQLDDANPWLQDKLRLTGHAKGQLQVAWQDDQLSKATGEILAQNITLQPISAPNQPSLPIETLSLKLSSDAAQANLNWQLNSSLIGDINGTLQSPIGKGPQSKIVGNVEIAKMTLSPLAPLLSQVLKQSIALSGEVNSKVTLNDLRQSTQLHGNIAVTDFAIATTAIPVVLHKSHFELDLQGYSAQLSSQLNGQRGGTLDLTGNIDWENDISGTIKAVGHDFLVSPEPNIALTLSPNLTLDYRNNSAIVTGRLSVPFGRIEMKSLPQGAIQPSEDQVIIDGPINTATRSPIDYSLDLDVVIEDDFRVKAVGLDSYIAGQLDLTKQSGKALLASGELSLREGKYKALGQDLQIQTGQIGFNGPLDKPYVNIRAIRNPEATANDVVAGVKLSGNISKPGLVIFTEPAMDQAHALAYLLNGQPLGEGESSNSSMLTQLILSQSIDLSKGFVSKVGKKIGFEDVSLSAKGSGASTKVEVSGYITPNIQVSYRMGVFESLNEFAVRYRVFSKLYIEATNGLYDSIDLLYKFDWDE